MENDYFSVLQRLKEERERRNLTQRLLCYYMKIQQSHFSKAETGQRRFSYHELKGLCTTDVDVLYMFTGIKAKNRREFPDASSTLHPEEAVCFLHTVFLLCSAAESTRRDKSYPGKIRQQLEYLQYTDTGRNSGTKSSLFSAIRMHRGYTQVKMADTLGVDIKKLRELEKGRQLPDSELIWKMYDLFRVSPAFVLKDAKGMLNELNYVLDLMEEEDRNIILEILKNEYMVIRPFDRS